MSHGFINKSVVSDSIQFFFTLYPRSFLSDHDLHISETLQKDPTYEDIYDKLCIKETFKEKMLERKTIMQVKYPMPWNTIVKLFSSKQWRV